MFALAAHSQTTTEENEDQKATLKDQFLLRAPALPCTPELCALLWLLPLYLLALPLIVNLVLFTVFSRVTKDFCHCFRHVAVFFSQSINPF